MGVPDKVITLPGISVWPSMINCEDEPAVYVLPWNVNAGATTGGVIVA